MLDIVLLIFFIFMTYKVVSGVIKEAPIYDEFKQTKMIALLAVLFPMGPIALWTLTFRLGWLPAVIIAICCYLPAIFLSRKQIKAYDCSGTDRTKKAQNIANQAFLASLVGFIYIGIYLVFIFIGSSMNNAQGT